MLVPVAVVVAVAALDAVDVAAAVAEDTVPSSWDEVDNIQDVASDDESDEVVVEEEVEVHRRPCGVDNAVASHTLEEVHIHDDDVVVVDHEDDEDASFVVVDALDDHNAMVADHNSFEVAWDDVVEDGNDEVEVVLPVAAVVDIGAVVAALVVHRDS